MQDEELNDNIIARNRTLNKMANAIQSSETPLTKADIADATGISRSYVGRMITAYEGKYFIYTKLGIIVNEDLWDEDRHSLIFTENNMKVKYPELLLRMDRMEHLLKEMNKGNGSNNPPVGSGGKKGKEHEPDLYDKLRVLVAIFKKKMPDMSDEMRKKIKVDMPFKDLNNQDEFNSNIIALALVIKVLEEKGSIKLMNHILDTNIKSANERLGG